MMPGGRMNPRMMRKLQQQLTKGMQEIPALEVIIRTADKEYLFKKPTVTAMEVAGQRTYQVVGTPEERVPGSGANGTGEPVQPQIPEQDVQLVMDQSGADAARARAALIECNGQPAEAILKLLG